MVVSMWFNKGRRALKAVNTLIADGDQLVISTLHDCPSGGRELVGHDFTMTRFSVRTPILTTPHRAMNFASAIKATVRRGIDIIARRGRAQRTGGTLMARALFVGGHGRQQCGQQ